MQTKKYMMIPLLLLSVFFTACQNDSGETEDERPEETTEDTADQTSEETAEEQNAEQDIDEEDNSEPETEEAEPAEEKEEGTAENEEILNQVIDRSEDLESYEALIDLEGSVDGAPYTLNAEAAIKDGDPPDLLLKSNDEVRTVAKDGSTYIFTGDDWVETTESMNIESLFFVTYDSTLNSLAELSGQLTKEETDDSYLFTYEGSNQSVYKAFQSLLGFEFGALDTSEIYSDLEVEVDKEDHVVEYIAYEASGEDEQGEYSMNGDVEFTSFNEVEEIELPSEIEEEN
ncbi:DUF6612 family protein [Lacicoccus qingdaonensis]|uniref:Outer membrane lipoprotein-sorting protein n=1 Tax=Lacicoccus qingdaonensis TaxID=576118 RepID=A0A1G9GYF6_9BACL|nr:DUF6612 family protein [Salinicoccus qingdaonensis]SDL05696.1 hypothetical protein SAMN05216216_11957 [Salinicoccus qingdaonensis]